VSTFEPARPRYTLPIAGKDYELLGTFGLIEAVEYAAKAHIGVVAVQIVNGMPASGLAKVLTAILTSSGHKTSLQDVSGLLWGEVGIEGDENQKLRLHLYAFLTICLAPPSQREAKAKDMGEMVGRLTAPDASPGQTTEGSASAS
jgi:hypothetical protein